MVKKCKRCQEEKDLSLFSKRKTGYYATYCKACNVIKTRERRIKGEDGYYSVYYLPEHHYVGITNNIKRRMDDHHFGDKRRSDNGKHTIGYEVLARFERKVDAAWFEVLLHQRGYLGSAYK